MSDSTSISAEKVTYGITTNTASSKNTEAQVSQTQKMLNTNHQQYSDQIGQFTNFGAGQLNIQESQLVNNMMLMNPYVFFFF